MGLIEKMCKLKLSGPGKDVFEVDDGTFKLKSCTYLVPKVKKIISV